MSDSKRTEHLNANFVVYMMCKQLKIVVGKKSKKPKEPWLFSKSFMDAGDCTTHLDIDSFVSIELMIVMVANDGV